MTLSRFMAVFPSIPIAERKMTCCVIDEQPISWAAAYEEIKKSPPTEMGERIQQKLISLGLI